MQPLPHGLQPANAPMGLAHPTLPLQVPQAGDFDAGSDLRVAASPQVQPEAEPVSAPRVEGIHACREVACHGHQPRALDTGVRHAGSAHGTVLLPSLLLRLGHGAVVCAAICLSVLPRLEPWAVVWSPVPPALGEAASGHLPPPSADIHPPTTPQPGTTGGLTCRLNWCQSGVFTGGA